MREEVYSTVGTIDAATSTTSHPQIAIPCPFSPCSLLITSLSLFRDTSCFLPSLHRPPTYRFFPFLYVTLSVSYFFPNLFHALSQLCVTSTLRKCLPNFIFFILFLPYFDLKFLYRIFSTGTDITFCIIIEICVCRYE